MYSDSQGRLTMVDLSGMKKNLELFFNKAEINKEEVQTKQTKENTQDASIIEVNEDSSIYANLSSNNSSSMTVIVDSDYGFETTKTTDKNGKIAYDSSAETLSMDDLINSAYGEETANKMTEAEKNSAAWQIVKNNQWMIDNVNQTYVAMQMVDELSAINGCEDVVNQILAGEITSESDIQNVFGETDGPLIEAAVRKYEATFDELIQSESYKTYSNKTDVNDIPPELIGYTDFSGEAGVKEFFAPNLSTLTHKEDSTSTNATHNISFNSENKYLDFSQMENLSEEAIGKAIAANYGLENLNNIQGKNILSQIAKDMTNAGMFIDENEAPEKVLEVIYDNLKSENADTEQFLLYCPDTTVSVISDEAKFINEETGEYDEALARQYLTSSSNKAGDMAYMHVKTDSVFAKGSNGVNSFDMLNEVQFDDNKTLAQELSEKGLREAIASTVDMEGLDEESKAKYQERIDKLVQDICDDKVSTFYEAMNNYGLQALAPDGMPLSSFHGSLVAIVNQYKKGEFMDLNSSDNKAIAMSAMQQLASNNPSLASGIEAITNSGLYGSEEAMWAQIIDDGNMNRIADIASSSEKLVADYGFKDEKLA